MTKKTVEIFVPDGYTAMASETSIGTSQPDCIITYLRKKPPLRRVFEETGEIRKAKQGDFYQDIFGSIRHRFQYGETCDKYRIFKEVKE